MRTVHVVVVLAVVVWGMGVRVAAQGTEIAEGERIVEIWTCTLNEGYTINDIGRIAERWGVLVRSSGAADTRSVVLGQLVGTIRGHETTSDVSTSFVTIDSFRDVGSWVAAKRAEETPAGKKSCRRSRRQTPAARTFYIVGGGTKS